MSDLISRESAIDAVRNYYDEQYDPKESIEELIEKLPSAQPKQRWIPCNERLPHGKEVNERYLVSLAWGGVGVMEYKLTGFHQYGAFSPVPIETVTAWMPLPKPYTESEGEDG